jgi:hypothetical protein
LQLRTETATDEWSMEKMTEEMERLQSLLRAYELQF